MSLKLQMRSHFEFYLFGEHKLMPIIDFVEELNLSKILFIIWT